MSGEPVATSWRAKVTTEPFLIERGPEHFYVQQLLAAGRHASIINNERVRQNLVRVARTAVVDNREKVK